MHKKLLILASITAVFSAVGISTASAQGLVRTNTSIELRGNATSSVVQTSVKAEVTTSKSTSTETRNERGNATSTEKSVSGEANAETHRSEVATLVRSLLSVADRQGGIGAEVRAVAIEQGETASTTAEAIVKVEKKGSFATFLFGTDYKNIGTLRSNMVTTDNHIARLKAVLDRTVGSSDKAELQAQIAALETTQAEIKAFVETKEGSFSLFGWLAKRLVK